MYVCVYICSMCVCVCVHVCMCVCICMRHGERSITALVCVWAQRQRELRCLRTLGLRSAPLSAAIPHLSSCSTPAPSTPPPLHPSTPPQRRQLGPCPVSTINLLPSLSLSLFLSFASTLAFFHSLNLPLLHIFLSLSFFHSLSLFLSLSFSLFCLSLHVIRLFSLTLFNFSLSLSLSLSLCLCLSICLDCHFSPITVSYLSVIPPSPL